MKYGTYVASGYEYGLVCDPDHNLPSLRSKMETCLGSKDQKTEPKNLFLLR